MNSQHDIFRMDKRPISASNGPTSLAVDNKPLCNAVRVTASHVCNKDGCDNNQYGHLDRHVVRQTAAFLKSA